MTIYVLGVGKTYLYIRGMTKYQSMDYTKDVNKIPYEKYGEMLTSGELLMISFRYDDGYVIVLDRDGTHWKVTCNMEKFEAILTRVSNG